MRTSPVARLTIAVEPCSRTGRAQWWVRCSIEAIPASPSNRHGDKAPPVTLASTWVPCTSMSHLETPSTPVGIPGRNPTDVRSG